MVVVVVVVMVMCVLNIEAFVGPLPHKPDNALAEASYSLIMSINYFEKNNISIGLEMTHVGVR